MSALPEKTPNLYQVHGAGLHVTYSTTSVDGRPRFVYHDANRTLTFEGDAIRTVGSDVGALVSVTIVPSVDAGSTTFTLLVPAVNLGQSDQLPIVTEGITTVHRFSLVPALNHGQTETYRVVRLTGTAAAVVF
jgi:hypothetical protein